MVRQRVNFVCPKKQESEAIPIYARILEGKNFEFLIQLCSKVKMKNNFRFRIEIVQSQLFQILIKISWK